MADPFDTRKSAYEVLTDEQMQEIAKKIAAGGTPNCSLCGNPLCVGPRKFLKMFGYIRGLIVGIANMFLRGKNKI